MIIQNLIITLLLYLQLSLALSKSISKIENSTSNLNSNKTSFSEVTVESILDKISEISSKYKQDVNGTIAEVHKLINADTSLPRLTRGEVIDILENLTQSNPDDLRQRVSKTRENYKKAIMLVMPYTSKNTDNFNMQELYTKPPVTHIIGDGKKSTTHKPPNSKKNVEILGLEPSTVRSPIKRPVKPVKVSKPIENQQETVKPIEQKPRKEVIIKEIQIKDPSVTTHKPLMRTRFPNHRYPDESKEVPEVSSNEGMKIIKAPNLVTKPSDTANVDYWHYAQKEVKPTNVTKPQRLVRPKPQSVQSSVYKADSTTIRPRIRSTTASTTVMSTFSTSTTLSPFDNIALPDDMKDTMKDLEQVLPLKSQKFSSQYDASSVNFPKEEMTTENVRKLLDSIGVLPGQNTTTVPDISEIADNLSPDMRELLMNFGLIENPNPTSYEPVPLRNVQNVPEKLEIDPYAYTQFKPLPDSAPTREDMEEFLASFGLTGNSQRSSKQIKPNEDNNATKITLPLTDVPNINMEMIPEQMHDVLEDIGLSKKRSRKLEDPKKSTHVFNPENTYVSEGEIKRLNQLLDTIKRLEKLNRTATPEDLMDLDLKNLKDLTNILKQEASISLDQKDYGPNPLDFDLSDDKNEIKRQQSSTLATSTTTEIPSSTEESKNLAALEESFGGNAGQSSEPEEASLPPPRPNGFYYLLDWNTFLEVGEEGRNKVNIRFSPQAGDPSRFLKVKVP